MMRAWGRIYAEDGTWTWVAAETTPSGDNSPVYLTWLIQVLKLGLGESPMFADWGIPAQMSVVQQLFPDYYVALVQQRFAPYFANLQISPALGANGTPTYNVAVTTLYGYQYGFNVLPS